MALSGADISQYSCLFYSKGKRDPTLWRGILFSSIKYRVNIVEYRVHFVEYRVKMVEYRVKNVKYQVNCVEY